MTTGKASSTRASRKAKTDTAKATPTIPTMQLPDTSKYAPWEIEAVQGYQSGGVFWIGQVPVRDLSAMFNLKQNFTSPLDRTQRTLSLKRVRKLVTYILNGLKNRRNPTPDADMYILPAVTVAIDADIDFQQLPGTQLGTLRIPFGTPLHIPDGQHRIEALMTAYRENSSELDCETVAICFYTDLGGKRRKQWFLDINQGAKVDKSLMTLFEQRSDTAEIARQVMEIPPFHTHTLVEGTNISQKSSDLFTLNSLHESCKILVKDYQGDDPQAFALEFWGLVAKHLPDWRRARTLSANLPLLRMDSIAFHAITLNALAIVGAEISSQDNWQEMLQKLETIDWRRYNADWKTVFMLDGLHIIKNQSTVKAFAAYIKEKIND